MTQTPRGESSFITTVSPTIYLRARWLACKVLSRSSSASLSPSDLTGAAIQRLNESGTRVPEGPHGPSRGRIFALLTLAMRSVVIERRRRRVVRARVESDRARAAGAATGNAEPEAQAQCGMLLVRLREISPRRADVFELRAVHGLSVAEAGQCLGVCERTIESDYRGARAWLQGELRRRSMDAATTN